MSRSSRGGLLALVAFVPLMGCRAGDSDTSAASRGPDTPVATIPGRSIVAKAVCDSVAERWSRANVRVTRSDGDTQVNSAADPVSACVVTAVTEDPDSTLLRRGSYWTDSTSHGWRGITRWDADGPDGSSRTLIRPGVRCQVDGEWDGGNDSEPTVKRSARVTERTTCWVDR